jgi:hypothetical protein
MRIFIQAGAAFVAVALATGTLPPLSPHWRAVAAELHQAQPRAKVKAGFLSLFQDKKD